MNKNVEEIKRAVETTQNTQGEMMPESDAKNVVKTAELVDEKETVLSGVEENVAAIKDPALVSDVYEDRKNNYNLFSELKKGIKLWATEKNSEKAHEDIINTCKNVLKEVKRDSRAIVKLNEKNIKLEDKMTEITKKLTKQAEKRVKNTRGKMDKIEMKASKKALKMSNKNIRSAIKSGMSPEEAKNKYSQKNYLETMLKNDKRYTKLDTLSSVEKLVEKYQSKNERYQDYYRDFSANNTIIDSYKSQMELLNKRVQEKLSELESQREEFKKVVETTVVQSSEKVSMLGKKLQDKQSEFEVNVKQAHDKLVDANLSATITELESSMRRGETLNIEAKNSYGGKLTVEKDIDGDVSYKVFLGTRLTGDHEEAVYKQVDANQLKNYLSDGELKAAVEKKLEEKRGKVQNKEDKEREEDK